MSDFNVIVTRVHDAFTRQGGLMTREHFYALARHKDSNEWRLAVQVYFEAAGMIVARGSRRTQRSSDVFAYWPAARNAEQKRLVCQELALARVV